MIHQSQRPGTWKNHLCWSHGNGIGVRGGENLVNQRLKLGGWYSLEEFGCFSYSGPNLWSYPLLLTQGQCPGMRLPLDKLPTHLHLWFLLFAFRVTLPYCWCLENHIWLRASAMSYPDLIFLRADSIPWCFSNINLFPLLIKKVSFSCSTLSRLSQGADKFQMLILISYHR